MFALCILLAFVVIHFWKKSRKHQQILADKITNIQKQQDLCENLAIKQARNISDLTSDNASQLATFNSINNCIVVINSELSIIHSNAFAQRFLGYQANELENTPFEDYLIRKDAIRFQYVAQSYLDTQNVELLEASREVKVLLNSQVEAHARLELKAQHIDGDTQFVATITDLSVIKQLTRVYEEQAELAKISNVSKSMFLAKMSHEIRTPLHGILGAIQLMEVLDDREKQVKLMRTAVKSGENLAAIINDILDLSKIESGEMTYENEPFLMSDLVKRILLEINQKADYNKVKVSCTFAEGFENKLLGDVTRIGQVMLNLMSNAVKFTKNGTVRLHIEFATSTLETSSLTINVIDTGIGISKIALQSLFEPFRQADDSITRIYGGSGLGLTISRNICRQLGGDLLCESKIGQGSTFTALIPIEVSTENVKTELNINENLPISLSKRKILMVEDNEINAEILREMLLQSDCTVEHAKDGKEALEYYEEFLPDIILMDIHMPRIDGVTACKILRSQGCQIPILAVTANVMKDDISNYRQNGFSGHVAKPILRDKLYNGISAALQ